MPAMIPTPYDQIRELLMTARAIAETHGLTDIEGGLCDQISDLRWHAEQDGEDFRPYARAFRQQQAQRLVLRHGAERAAK